MGSRPDGWWRHRPAGPAPRAVPAAPAARVRGSPPGGGGAKRAAAAARLLAELAPLLGSQVTAPDGRPLTVVRLVAVLEGRARDVAAPEGVEAVRATADGDSAVVAVAEELADTGDLALVVTADRGLRARLPSSALVAGPRWILGG